MKRSFFIRIIALAASVALLTGALVVAAVSGSPYELLKGALLGLGNLENHSVKASMSVTLDGQFFEAEDTYNEYVMDGYSLSVSDGFSSYASGNTYLSLDSDGRGNFYSYGNDGYTQVYSPFNVFGIGSLDEDARYMRLFEMGVDLVVGDLKNNIAMSQTGDIRHVSGTLTANQIPELYNAAFDLLMAQSGGSYFHIEDSYDMSTLDMSNMTIMYKYVFMENAAIYERTTECSLHPIGDFSNYITPEAYANMQNGGFIDNVLYLDGVFYEIWHENTIGEKETPLTESEYYTFDLPEGQLPPVQSAQIVYVHGEADIDGTGNIVKFYGNAGFTMTDVFGKTHELDVIVNAEINELTTTTSARYEKIMKAVAAFAPDNSSYYDISFTLDANDNPIIENIYDGRNSDYKFENSIYVSDMPAAVEIYPQPTFIPDGTMPEPTPVDTEIPFYDLWLTNRVLELAADPIYEGLDITVLETIARNEYVALYGSVE